MAKRKTDNAMAKRKTDNVIILSHDIVHMIGGRSGRDRMVVGFTTIYEIGAYHYLCCGFDIPHIM
jgi:hypothetical protein